MERRSTHALLAITLMCCAAVAQQPQQPDSAEASEAASKAAEKRAELEKMAVALLRDAAEEAQSLKLVENRVRAYTVAASALWPRDEKAARAFYKSVADALAAYGSSLDPEDPQFSNSAQSLMQMRGELVQSLAQLDPKLALEYLRATRTMRTEDARALGLQLDAQEQQLELGLAARVASQDPASALRMAEASLRRGVTSSLVQVLQELRTKDPEAASRLAAEIVKRLRSENLLTNYEAAAVAQQLLTISQPDAPPPPRAQVAAGGFAVKAAAPGGAPAAPLLDAQTRADLVEKILSTAASEGQNQPGTYNVFNALQMLMPEVEKTNPARAESLRKRAAAMERTFNPQADAWREYREISEKGNVDALLEAAPKAPPEVRDQLYTQAVWKAMGDGDAERARQIVDSISNPQQRGQMRKTVEAQSQMRAAQQGNFAEARAAVSRLPTAEERLTALIQIAAIATSKGDARTARQMLSEAGALVAAQPAGPQQFNAQLQLAEVYSQTDPGAGFELIESSIARLNELLDAAASLEGFYQDSFRDGELRPQYGYVWGNLVSRCATTLATLAPSDFERASADAKSFRRADVRVAVELQLAQGVLGGMSNGRAPIQGRRIIMSLPRQGIID
jgi:hypothetical protein